jgi:serine/threonine protein kinase
MHDDRFIGQQFGNYRLLRVLGQGSFAVVYLGEHIYLKSFAAIKILHARLSSDLQESFRNEARMLALLSHMHIVRLLDFGIKEEIPFLVMEYAPHGTLRQRHPAHGKVPLFTVAAYVKQISNGLYYAHKKKLIHRDLKPENILVGEQDELLISDFGVALIVHTTRSLHDAEDVFAGTAPYMAPEQLRGVPQFASDQYALGIMVYEWLCGTRPFQGTLTELYKQHLFVPPQALRKHVPQLPASVEQVVLTALEKEPERRFTNIQAFAVAFERACQQEENVIPDESLLILPHPEPSMSHLTPESPDSPALAIKDPQCQSDSFSSTSSQNSDTTLVAPESMFDALSSDPNATIPMVDRPSQTLPEIKRPKFPLHTLVLGGGLALLFILGTFLTMMLHDVNSHSRERSGSVVSVTPTTAPLALPSPAKRCRVGSVSSHPIYHGNGYAFSNGGTYRSASKYCNGRVYFAFTSAPPIANTQVRLCVANSVCGNWVQYTTVNSKLLIMQNLAPGTSFHLQFQGYGAVDSYTVSGKMYY